MTTEALIAELKEIYQEILDLEPLAEKISGTVHPDFGPSARNLIRYLALRNHDLRELHDPLSDLGLSSLRSAEGYVLTNLYRVLELLHLLVGQPWPERKAPTIIGFKHSKSLIRKHSNLLFNRPPDFNTHEIMVTMPDKAAQDVDLIVEMAKRGMTIARINLSHGDEPLWLGMVENIREAARRSGKDLRIYMDLAGPKIRIKYPAPEGKEEKKVKALPMREGRCLQLEKHPVAFDRFREAVKSPDISTPIPVQISIPEIIDALKVGDSVFFDDGVIKAEVTQTKGETAVVKVTRTFKSKLKADKGMNLPQLAMELPSLTQKDRDTLPFIAQHADLLGYSFVQRKSDVIRLYERLEELGDQKPGVIFKIENQKAFNRLSHIILEGMKHNRIGVMIARGDLAVEIGFDRISEVQNEILLLCEAAHVPVIWATQVLDNLAKKGIATRAEISDAALSVRSECVMLNKGPYILEAISELRTILNRMESHSSKNKNALRPLRIARKNLKRIKSLWQPADTL
ncbi:MAG: pyruvate kinase [Robiginitalea sp.]|nr:pyruvate kinase [Robiginitalea sp.]